MGATFALAVLLGTTPLTQAQDLPAPGDGFAWERVGDVGIDVFDLAFGPDGTLWAIAGAPYRLDLSGGFPGEWVLLLETGAFAGAMLPLGGDGPSGPGPDTLVATTTGSTRRSLDGGHSWSIEYGEGDDGLYAVPGGPPHAGRLLVGDRRVIAYSDDRGATWTTAKTPPAGPGPGGADDFAAFPPGSPHPGRVLAAGIYGVSISDDGGETFRESGLWAFQYGGQTVGVVEQPGRAGGYTALMVGYENAQPDLRVWASDDGGEGWHPEGGQHLPEGPPVGIGNSNAELLSLGGASAVAVLGRGTVYRTDDGGETWAAVGRAPEINENRFVASAALGPDGRLYVGLAATGTERGWVWRTGEVVVASEPAPDPEPGEVLGVAVVPNPSQGAATVVLTLEAPAEVEAVLYDPLGRRMALLASGAYGAGTHEVRIGAGGSLTAGVYVVRVTAQAGTVAPPSPHAASPSYGSGMGAAGGGVAGRPRCPRPGSAPGLIGIRASRRVRVS